jgi:hypothetical protein
MGSSTYYFRRIFRNPETVVLIVWLEQHTFELSAFEVALRVFSCAILKISSDLCTLHLIGKNSNFSRVFCDFSQKTLVRPSFFLRGENIIMLLWDHNLRPFGPKLNRTE